jgi:hypothetical protein
MNLFFSFLSVVYISVIFLYADSPIVSQVGPFNPFSILHIPLYMILTILIVLSIVPFHLFRLFRSNPFPSHLPVNASTHEQVDDRIGPDALNVFNEINQMNQSSRINQMNQSSRINQMNQTIRFLTAGFISLVVAVADEYHQSFIPTRQASFTDILLDMTGIILALWLVHKICKRQATCQNG